MPELPDVLAYVQCLEQRIVDRSLASLLITSPFVLRSVDPPADTLEGKTVQRVDRIGKRFVFAFSDDLFLVTHLMLAGRWRWTDRPGARPPGKVGLAALRFDNGTLLLVESSTQKRAAMHVVRGCDQLAPFNRGGVDPLICTREQFADALQRENHTLKRTLTDPRLFDGIGNAYSDEILHAAGLSPLKWSTKLSDEEIDRLHTATHETLEHWIEVLARKFAAKFPGPGQITAFRPDFAAHGKYDKPCPTCGTKIQRIIYAENETNYCPRCQTGGKLLADRSLSRLLHDDWPRTIEELEDQR